MTMHIAHCINNTIQYNTIKSTCNVHSGRLLVIPYTKSTFYVLRDREHHFELPYGSLLSFSAIRLLCDVCVDITNDTLLFMVSTLYSISVIMACMYV